MPELTTFASRVSAPYIVGEVNPDGWKNSTDLLNDTHLSGWNVRLREIETDARSDKAAFEAVRTNPFDGGLDRLGIHGERYGEVQNEDVFRMFDPLDPTWDAAGSFRGGRVVYGSAVTDKTIVLDPQGANDVITPRLHIFTSHDGSGALKIGRYAERMACLNMMNAIVKGMSQTITIRHTLTIQDRMKAISLAWKTNNAVFDKFAEEANALFEQSCTDKEFFSMVGHLMGERPEENKKGAQTKYDNSLELFSQAWRGEPNANVHGTRWGALQAMVERNQWGRTIQNTPNGVENFAMAGMGLDQNTNAFRARALELVQTF